VSPAQSVLLKEMILFMGFDADNAAIQEKCGSIRGEMSSLMQDEIYDALENVLGVIENFEDNTNDYIQRQFDRLTKVTAGKSLSSEQEGIRMQLDLLFMDVKQCNSDRVIQILSSYQRGPGPSDGPHGTKRNAGSRSPSP
jgi:hypothetical protein